MSNTLYAEYAISLGLNSQEEMWKIQLLHPHDSNKILSAWIPMDDEDSRIGTIVDNLSIAKPGLRLLTIIKGLHQSISYFPYYWPFEGKYVDKFGYDFEIVMDSEDVISEINLTDIAYEIASQYVDATPPSENPVVDVMTSTVEPGGALVKISITLDRPKPVSEFSMAPFTKYPMELAAITYEEDIDTYHPPKEIPIPQATEESSQWFKQDTTSIRFQFPAVIAKRLTIILRQKNYELNTYLIRETSFSRQDLWEKISNREAEVTLDLTDGLESISNKDGDNVVDEWSGWNIYLQELAAYYADLAAWESEVAAYNQAMADIAAAEAEQAYYDSVYQQQEQEWQNELSQAVASYDARYQKYQSDYAEYQSATQHPNYQKNIDYYTNKHENYQKNIDYYTGKIR